LTAVCVTARVTSFDTARGTGTVVTDDGRELGFHATRISDGSRAVEVGARVAVRVGPGAAPGTWEAVEVLKV
jgi:cold shock CspA family protein